MTNSVLPFQVRHQLYRSINSFFDTRDYLSIDTPILVHTPGTEVHIDYFATQWHHFDSSKHKLYMRSSPELHLKRAICLGLKKVYQISKCFRNHGELTKWHHPEFTMLEWYETGISYENFMSLTEEFLRFTTESLRGIIPDIYSLPKKIQRISVYEAFESFAGITLIDQDEELAAKAISRNFHSISPHDDFETAFFKIQIDVIEPALRQMEAVFLFDYPPSQAALARIENNAAKRFELYVKGVELCNAFWELLDPMENRERFGDSQRRRAILGKSAIEEDDDFYHDLELGMPDCCGNALGIDRWLAILMNKNNIGDIIPFRYDSPYHKYSTLCDQSHD